MSETVADYIMDRLVHRGVRHIFTVPGLQIDPLILAALRRSELQLIVATNEATAGFMADGYARARGGFGVCLTIGSIGLSHAHPAVLTAHSDFSRVLFLAGTAPVSLSGQGAFQDNDAIGVSDVDQFRTTTEYAAKITDAGSTPRVLNEAIHRMFESPAGPALLSIPFDVQQQSAGDAIGAPPSIRDECASIGACVDQLAELLEGKSHVVVLAGGRANEQANAVALRSLAERYSVPVATTLAAKGLLPENHPLSLGNLGFGGRRRAIEALLDEEIEVLILLGADWNERDSMNWDSRLAPPGRLIVRIDTLPDKCQGPLPVHHRFHADPLAVLAKLESSERLAAALRRTTAHREEMVERWQQIPWCFGPPADTTLATIGLDQLVVGLRTVLPDDTLFFCDAGLQRVFAGAYWESRRPLAFHSSFRLGGMGWTCGAAAGAQLARPDCPVVLLIGDGAMLMHGQELATMVRYGLPIIVVLCNNQSYGSIQQRMNSEPKAAETTRTPDIDWAAFADSLGAEAVKLRELSDLASMLAPRLGATPPTRPILLEVATDHAQPMPHLESTRSGYHYPFLDLPLPAPILVS